MRSWPPHSSSLPLRSRHVRLLQPCRVWPFELWAANFLLLHYWVNLRGQSRRKIARWTLWVPLPAGASGGCGELGSCPGNEWRLRSLDDIVVAAWGWLPLCAVAPRIGQATVTAVASWPLLRPWPLPCTNGLVGGGHRLVRPVPSNTAIVSRVIHLSHGITRGGICSKESTKWW